MADGIEAIGIDNMVDASMVIYSDHMFYLAEAAWFVYPPLITRVRSRGTLFYGKYQPAVKHTLRLDLHGLIPHL